MSILCCGTHHARYNRCRWLSRVGSVPIMHMSHVHSVSRAASVPIAATILHYLVETGRCNHIALSCKDQSRVKTVTDQLQSNYRSSLHVHVHIKVAGKHSYTYISYLSIYCSLHITLRITKNVHIILESINCISKYIKEKRHRVRITYIYFKINFAVKTVERTNQFILL